MDIEILSWHDGILNGYNFNPNYGKENEITIHLSLYPFIQSKYFLQKEIQYKLFVLI